MEPVTFLLHGGSKSQTGAINILSHVQIYTGSHRCVFLYEIRQILLCESLVLRDGISL